MPTMQPTGFHLSDTASMTDMEQKKEFRQTWVEPAVATCAVIGLMLMSYQILAPFLAALIWAGILVYATWQPYMLMVRLCRGNRLLPATVMLVVFTFVIVAPMLVAGVELSANVDQISDWLHDHVQAGLPTLPAWIVHIPWVGPHLDTFWHGIASGDPEVMARVREWSRPLGGFLLKMGAAVGSGVLLLFLSMAFSFFFYISGHELIHWLMVILRRIGGQRGQELMLIAGGTVRGVVYGFIGTALVQGALAWFGYLIAGVPNAAAFGLISCFLSLIPGGPSLLGLPVALWLYHDGSTGWAIFLAVWMVGVVSMADNVVKPLLIGKESNLPFVLILIGVVGGAMAWGVLGVFLGPTLLAVSYTLLHNWARFDLADVTGTPPAQPKEPQSDKAADAAIEQASPAVPLPQEGKS
ncbi:putative PurR-regulated permease PerM [Silvimonas terrae]|uniref:Putative PurR-regulated permease PerM n=1 Tax=Silvimonas terrae TaxID=300266 RepID=A0A840RH07_9NEIS|nr:AI-2E family transporter [Silvimonas terrae]MBB5191563.1 putative PurR-regulated permease PerM [Silvimonas terrae]